MEEKEIIVKTIKKIEKEENVKILFLIESGSSAWGWESEDSDYDVRGVYIQDYLVVQHIKEQIDRKISHFDITLWDFRKFLRLMRNSIKLKLCARDFRQRQIKKSPFCTKKENQKKSRGCFNGHNKTQQETF